MLPTLQAPAFMARLFAGRARPRVTRWYATHVRHGATRELTPPAGQVVLHCRQGQAWVTQDGSQKDVVLAAKDSWKVPPGERLYVHALDGDCVLEMQVEDQAAGDCGSSPQ